MENSAKILEHCTIKSHLIWQKKRETLIQTNTVTSMQKNVKVVVILK